MNKQKFMHYAFMTVLYAFGAGTLGLIVFSMITAFNHL